MKRQKKSFIIIGLGRFGLGIVEKLSQLTAEIIAVDIDEKEVVKAGEFIENCIVCDASNVESLKELGVANIDHAIVAIGDNIQATILTTIALKELNVPKVTVRVDDEYFIPVMKKIGADHIVFPEKAAAISLANQIISDSILDYYNVAENFAIVEIAVNPNFKEISLIELNSQNRFEVSIVLVKRGHEVILPKASMIIKPSDKILVVGKNYKIVAFDEYINK